jgi:hypothetical protein
VVTGWVEHDNTVRVRSAIGHVTPQTTLQGRAEQIGNHRNAKLKAARTSRRNNPRRKRDIHAEPVHRHSVPSRAANGCRGCFGRRRTADRRLSLGQSRGVCPKDNCPNPRVSAESLTAACVLADGSPTLARLSRFGVFGLRPRNMLYSLS